MEQNTTPLPVTLYTFKNKDNDPEHEVKTTIAFDEVNLVVSEYMAGDYMRQHVGQHDFTYTITLKPEAIAKLAAQLGAAHDDKSDLLQKFATKFNGEKTYALTLRFLSDHAIEYEEGGPPVSWF